MVSKKFVFLKCAFLSWFSLSFCVCYTNLLVLMDGFLPLSSGTCVSFGM